MARNPGTITTILSLATCILSIPLIVLGVWLLTASVTICLKFLEWPLLSLGISTLVVSLAGFTGGRCHVSCLQWTYFVLMFFDILLLLIFTSFLFVVTNQATNLQAETVGFTDYKLQSYPDWLRRQVENTQKWRRIVRCMKEAGYCEDLVETYSIGDVSRSYFSTIQAGCCRPLDICGYQCVNPIHWVNPTNGAADRDCLRWSNDPSKLCYRCDTCKSALLQMVRRNWRKAAKVSLVFLIFLIALYSMGCCAFLSSSGARSVPSTQCGCGQRW